LNVVDNVLLANVLLGLPAERSSNDRVKTQLSIPPAEIRS